MTRSIEMTLAFLAGLGAAACGGDGGNPVALADLGGELGAVACERLAACCTTEELMNMTLGAEDEAECVLVYEGLLGQLLIPVFEDSVAAGRMTYDGEAMRGCLDVLAGLSCEELGTAFDGGLFGGCEDPFIGHVDNGGECATDGDCVSGYCSGDSIDFDGNITYGTCAVAPGVGEPCDDYDCADGAWCDSGAPNEPTCAAPQADGADCWSDDECASGGCNRPDSSSSGTCGVSMECDGM